MQRFDLHTCAGVHLLFYLPRACTKPTLIEKPVGEITHVIARGRCVGVRRMIIALGGIG